MTVALGGGEWSAARPGRTLPPGKIRYSLYMRLGGPQGRSGRAENLVPTGIRSRTVQPVVSRYTDWATLKNSSDVTVGYFRPTAFLHSPPPRKTAEFITSSNDIFYSLLPQALLLSLSA